MLELGAICRASQRNYQHLRSTNLLCQSLCQPDDVAAARCTDGSGSSSLDASVKHYLRLCGARPSVEIDPSTIRSICTTALGRIAPLASKPGPRADLNFRFLMEALFLLAKKHHVHVTLPSRQIKGRFGSPDRTPFFQFCRAVLDLALTKGRVAIEQAELALSEKECALKKLSHSNRTDGGLLETLHIVRQYLSRRKRKDRAVRPDAK